MITGRTVLVFPFYDDNPFLNVLSLAPMAEGWVFRSAGDFDDWEARSDRLSPGDVMHLHWTAPILQTAETQADAERRLVRCGAMLSRAHRRGIGIIWTVHNQVPHELVYADQERRLIRLISERADLIHVMSPSTVEVLADICRLPPEKVRPIPHPSYEAVYGDGPARRDARASFELTDSDRAVLFFGNVRAYKGVQSLIDAIRHVQNSEPSGVRLALLLAGRTPPSDRALIESALAPLKSVGHFDFVPEQEVGRWFRAADVAVFPFEKVLNSGSVHLAATFRVPVILPDVHHLRRDFGEYPWVRTFDANDPVESLASSLRDGSLFSSLKVTDFDPFLRSRAPWATSLRYRWLLQEAHSIGASRRVASTG